MAQRGKRINRSDNDLASCPGAIKRRKCRLGPAAGNSSAATATLGPSEEEETMASSSQGGASWTPRPLNDIKSTIYNRSATEAPAELFRKDLISAMKLPDSEPLSPKEYWVITDQWKQEWERGVQVPVNPDSLPEPAVTVTQASPSNKLHGEFKLPKKFIRISRDDWFNTEEHHLSTTPARAEKACAYDLDDTDIAWLGVLNGERAQAGQSSITEPQLERVIEELEVRCWERIQTIVKNAEGLGIEFDENVICDVCRSPDSEEGNEMVFCDCCNICVHQACYGITSIPDGSWLCRTCSLSQRPDCVLCPNKGGAMKCTRSGQKWAHVSCALWIPEVSIGCVERMEPITKISSIPQSRWALICVLCRDRVGACIQCSIKTCKTAYHVTCAFKHGLEMKAIIEDEMADDGVKLRSYCQKHSRTNTKDKVGVGGGVGSSSGKGGSDSEDGEARKRKRKDMTSEEKNQARAAKLQEIEAEFDKHVSLNDITSQQHDVDPDGIVYIYNYWKLKRRAGHNKPLLAPRCGELSGAGARAQGQAADLEKMRTFVQLRQDLERVRNLCYMVGRREKLCRSFLRLREQTFHKQALVMSGPTLPPNAATAVLEANHGPSIYDRLYSHPYAEDHIHDLDVIVARIAGNKSPTPVSSDEKKVQTDFNGVSKENSKMDNPYKNLYLNGSVRRNNLYDSDLSSISNSETDTAKPTVQSPNKTKKLDLATDTSTDEESAPSKLKVDVRKSKKSIITGRSRTLPRDSSESDKMDTAGSRSRTLQQMERELVAGVSGSDSDELLPLNTTFTSRHVLSNPDAIYSDTDSDSQEHAHAAVLRTKAAVKEFSAGDVTKNAEKNFVNKDKPQEQYADEMTKSKDTVKISKKKEYVPTALIVPQRQAAKKASEIMQRSQNKKEMLAESEMTKSPLEETTKLLKPVKQKVGKQKDGKSGKDSKNNDIYDFDKEFGDGSEILAYVPQRQAAKKAAEHIKSGMGTKAGQPELETPEAKMKKDSPEQARKKEKEPKKEEKEPKKEEKEPKKEEREPKKEEKEPKKEESPKKSKKLSENATPATMSSNSESSSSSSCSSSSESSSDSEDCKSSALYAPTSTVDQVNSASTSSDSDNSNQVEVHTVTKRYYSKSVDSTIESDAVPKKAVGRKIKKLPDKKLKTSDGRHGLEFQPPPFEREESGRSSVSKEQPEQQDNKKSDPRESSKNLVSPVRSETVCSPLSGSRDNDGARNIFGPKSTKKTVQIPKQSQQSTIARKDEPSTITKTKADARKRKSSEVPQKEEKNSKSMAALKKIEKRLTDRSGAVQKCDRKNESSVIEIDGSKESLDDTTVKTEDKKFKKTASKTSVNTLEEEIKQRKAERESPKKSSRGLDKLLEKREHLDKLSKAKKPDDNLETEVQIDEAARNKEIHPAKIISHNTIKNEDEPNNEKDTRPSSHEPDRRSRDFKETPANPCLDFKQKSEIKIDHQPEVPTQYGENIANVDNRDNSDDVVAKSIPTSEKLETGEKDSHRRRKSTNRSIFSPQHGSKDPSDADLFDFDHDLLAVEEMVNDDGFSIPRDPEERAPPLTFSFNNELWFKEDSKEDSARETLHLVEKLRLELSKKSSSGHSELESVAVEEETKKEEELLDKSTEQDKQDKEIKMLELDTNVMGGVKNDENVNRMSSDLCCKNQCLEEKDKPCYPQEQYVSHNNENMETGKVTVAEREKLDRAEADERWVPPSIENFNPNDVHLNTLIDNRSHCYGGHQFPNDTSISESNNDAIVHSQMNLNIQEQYQLLQQSHQLMRPAQHIDPLSESRVQPIQMVDQVAQLPTQIVDEITPMEMVNRHLIGLPNAEEDQGVDIEVHGLEKEDISSDMRQDYNQSESPYTDIGSSRQDTRWAENQVLPSRRSTSSSITSASSTEDHSAMPSYKNIAPIPFPPCSMEQSVYHSYSEASSYAAPVSLFPPQSCATSLPYPSPGTAMFPPPFGAPFPTPQSMLPHVSKPLEDALNMQASPCTAAFTSSSHNMALTAAMISPTKIPTPPPQPQMITDDEQIHEPQQERQEPLPRQSPPPPVPTSPPLPPSSLPSHHQQQQASISLQPNTSALPLSFLNNMSETPVSEPVVENLQEMAIENRSTQPGKKSPAKPTRSSARVTSLQAKSPGKSPRQEPLKSVTATKSRSRAPKSSTQAGYKSRARGRGRGRGRGGQGASATLNASLTNIVHNNDDTIRSKLVGTVYDFDFDEDSATETNIADLRTMRERKKSTDVSEKREGLGILSEGLHLSHLSSPSSHNKYNDNKRLSPPENQNNAGTGDSKSSANQTFSDTVLPLLPGPVDMRTYNSTVDAQTSSLHTQSYTNHLLGTFTSGTADQALPDIDEDYEKEFHSALIASKHTNTCTDPNLSQPITETPMLNISDSNKVSLTDSRNQLKVKIKGPFLDANYVPASSVPPLAQQAPVIITPTATSASVASGTSSLRRMRKKELLRQYWTQDMNMDDSTCGNVASAPISIPPVSRPGITIPKAVASMTSFPTREDYKAVVDANMEKKRRKERGSILDMVDEDGTSDRRRNSGASSIDKRRGRQTRPSATNVANSGLAPKLKIKFGNSILGQELSNMQDDRSRIKPPKKRLSSIPNKPSIEELKRESMKFRRMIMAGFENDEKPKVKSKKDKNGKRKKKHPNKKEGRVQLLDEGPAPPKLIIRLGKGSNTATNVNDVASNETLSVASVVPDDKKVGNLQPSGNNRVGPQPTEPSKEDTTYPSDSNIEDKLPTDPNAGATSLRNIRSAKVTPIRLKLTRCQEGYELKAPAISSACDNSAKVNLNSILAPEDVPVMETKSKESSTKQSSKEDDIPLLSQHTAHKSPSCPPPPLPQGCQVR